MKLYDAQCPGNVNNLAYNDGMQDILENESLDCHMAQTYYC